MMIITLAALLAAPADPGLPVSAWVTPVRDWKTAAIPRERYLEIIEGLCRFSIRHQDGKGAIIDPFVDREFQYATPYFAYAVGALVEAGRARDLLSHGVRAMEHATTSFAGGRKTIPDDHGEFFVPVLTGALDLYRGLAPDATLSRWRERLKVPLTQVIRGGTNNWETYPMKGEWMRARAGLVRSEDAIAYIERVWRDRQAARIVPAPWYLYRDLTSDPDTLSVEAVGRGNLLGLVHHGYAGPSRAAIERAAESATLVALLLQEPSGQAPTNGRTDNHVWVDVGYQLSFEVMAERLFERGEVRRAGQLRRAALLALGGIDRWRREDGAWAGSYFITKNRLDPKLRVGYQTASQYSNYNGSLMYHLAEAYHVRHSAIDEQPTPSELGGYAFALDDKFAAVFANAGGLLVQANLRGQVGVSNGNRWTPLGVVRFARAGWDSRLGPSDGALDETGGVSFAPTFAGKDGWVRLADQGARYGATWSAEFVHPVMVRGALEYRPKTGQSGPAFRQELLITPDFVLSTVRQLGGQTVGWGVTWPVLESDGRPLTVRRGPRMVSLSFPRAADEQSFIAVDGPVTFTDEAAVRGSYGDLRPIRVVTRGTSNTTLIYPRGSGDPTAEDVGRSFRRTARGFRTLVGTVDGRVYIGRSAAGGEGSRVDLDGDGRPEVTFTPRCQFLVRHRGGKVTELEVDRPTVAVVQGRRVQLGPHTPYP